MYNATPLIVYNASAGSGKTYTLVKEYLALALQHPANHQQILAVTFTNKATREMKMRILSALYTLAVPAETQNQSNGYVAELTARLSLSPQELQMRAAEVLQRLLHNYDYFFVETIDRFFQRLLRNLTRELGINSYYNISLNSEDLLEKAIERTMDAAETDEALFAWIRHYTQNLLDDDKKWDFSKPLLHFSKEMLKEKYQSYATQLQSLATKPHLEAYKQKIAAVESHVNDTILSFYNEYVALSQQHGFQVDSFAGKSKSAATFFLKLPHRNKYDLADFFLPTYLKAVDDTDCWFTKSEQATHPLRSIVENDLRPLMQQAMEHLRRCIPILNTANLVRKHIDNLGLMTNLFQALEEIKKEEYQFLLSDTVHFLDRMVGKEDVSFVYEKIGTQFQHIIIDEFQDTSRLSWNNFRKLIQENIDAGRTNVLAGDVKQSIYRWNNGDWRLLKDIAQNLYTERSVGFSPDIRYLDTNYRTDSAIVSFNNDLFTNGLSVLANHLSEAFATESQSSNYDQQLRAMYADVHQQHVHDNGYVRVFFAAGKNKEQYETLLLNDMVQNINHLQDQGVSANDITILIRNNKDLDTLNRHFSQYQQTLTAAEQRKYCYTTVSDEAFIMSNSPVLRLIIHALQYVINPTDRLCQNALILDHYSLQHAETDAGMEAICEQLLSATAPLLPPDFLSRRENLRFQSLSDAIEEIVSLFHLQEMVSQSGYLFAFYDSVMEYTQTHSATISSFLSYWEAELCDKKVPLNEHVYGLRVLSIHKSKGMEFNHVFIPFCHWKFYDLQHGETLWVETTGDFSDLPLVPIPLQSKMGDSLFEKEYYEELFLQTIDNLNLLYVALTRPRHSLFLGMHISENQAKESTFKTVGDWIYHHVTRHEHHHLPFVSDSENVYHCGTLQTAFSADSAADSQNPFNVKSKEEQVSFSMENGAIVYAQTTDAAEFISSLQSPFSITLSERSERHKGIVFHRLLSLIRQPNDIDRAIDSLLMEGIVLTQDIDYCRAVLSQMFRLDQAKEWFSESYDVVVEADFILQEQQHIRTKRPDRIIKMEKQTVVLDYKFGDNPKGKSAHHQQINDYINLLSAMGYPNVQGVLWYVDLSKMPIDQFLIYA